MLRYESPEMEVLRFRAEDILGVSSGYAGGDGEPGDGNNFDDGSTVGEPGDGWFDP